MSTHRKVFITKASGQQVPFSEERLRKSLLRSGASGDLVTAIIKQVAEEIYEGMPTEIIYEKAFSQLRRHPEAMASRYKLKKALMELGPTGFPFEQFMARLFQSMGYTTQTGQILKGRCVQHEVDVIGQKDKEWIMMECKFHNQTGVPCDVKVPLYISARFRDIEEEQKKNETYPGTVFQGWVATNTHFTNDAIAFWLCAGLRLIGWDYPRKEGLKDLVDKHELYPITSLTTITHIEKQQLLAQNIVLVNDIRNNKDLLSKMITTPERLSRIFAECADLCGHIPKSDTRV